MTKQVANSGCPTLQDLELLPSRDPRIRVWMGPLGRVLRLVIERGIRATARGNPDEIAAFQDTYRAIRGEKGNPSDITEYVARPEAVGDIVVDILSDCRPELSRKTISCYVSSSCERVEGREESGYVATLPRTEGSPGYTISTHSQADRDRPCLGRKWADKAPYYYLNNPKYRALEVLQGWYSGRSYKSLAAELHLGKGTIARMIHALCPHTCLWRGRMRKNYLLYPDVDADAVERLFFEDKTSDEVAAILKSSKAVVLKIFHAKRPNVSMKKHGRKARLDKRHHPKAEGVEVIRMKDDGKSFRAIAERFGVSVETVRTIYYAMRPGTAIKPRWVGK
jgi:hypothetical protein